MAWFGILGLGRISLMGGMFSAECHRPAESSKYESPSLGGAGCWSLSKINKIHLKVTLYASKKFLRYGRMDIPNKDCIKRGNRVPSK